MKVNELRNLDDAKLESIIEERYKELFNLRFQQVAGQLTNTARPRQARREIARIKTILRERALEHEG